MFGETQSGNGHPWLLVGPWYRWAEPGLKASGRVSAPAIEKFGSPKFIAEFLGEPQRSLKYEDKDYVHEAVASPSRFNLSGKIWRKVTPECRKLFLDTHSRFYLVVCELHCDAAGLPAVDRGKVCEAGLVVRRAKPEIPPEIFHDYVGKLEQVAVTKAEILQLRQLSPGVRRRGLITDKVIQALRGDCDARTVKLLTLYARQQQELEALATTYGVALAHQGWQRSEHEGIGAWVDVEETPQEVVEDVFPLYPLIPDPREASHSARGRTLYYGVVPTATSDVDEYGSPRFDDQGLYEIRCFVRRHKCPCPKTAERNDCPGELVWSPSTEKYRLAAPMDLDGTGNRPVTIQLPDLEALKAQSESFPAADVRMVTPPGSVLPFDINGEDVSDVDPDPPGGGFQICFFAIPLITIVAMFVLRLFLPIVVFLFGLWFLLKLKFCIPPSISLGGGADLSLAVAGQLEFDVDVSVAVQLGISEGKLGDILDDLVPNAFGKLVGDELLADPTLDNDQLFKLVYDLSQDFSSSLPPEVADKFEPFDPGPAAVLPSVTAGLDYHDVLEVPAA